MRTTAGAVALIVVLAGCGSPTATPVQPSSSPGVPGTDGSQLPSPNRITPPSGTEPRTGQLDPAPSETAMDEQGGALTDTLTFDQAGGFVPLETLVIEPDGTAILESGGEDPVEFTIDDDRLASIAAVANKLGDMEPNQVSDPPVVDVTNWEIVHGDADVIADAEAVSDELLPLVEDLQVLLDEHRLNG